MIQAVPHTPEIRKPRRNGWFKNARSGWFKEEFPHSRWDFHGQWIGDKKRRKRLKAELLAADPHCCRCRCELTTEPNAVNQLCLSDDDRLQCRACAEARGLERRQARRAERERFRVEFAVVQQEARLLAAYEPFRGC